MLASQPLIFLKDLHRTGYSTITSNESTEEDRLLLKKVLLAYARWNQAVGYCQGFNVLAALLLRVTESDDAAAFKVRLPAGFVPCNRSKNHVVDGCYLCEVNCCIFDGIASLENAMSLLYMVS